MTNNKVRFFDCSSAEMLSFALNSSWCGSNVRAAYLGVTYDFYLDIDEDHSNGSHAAAMSLTNNGNLSSGIDYPSVLISVSEYKGDYSMDTDNESESYYPATNKDRYTTAINRLTVKAAQLDYDRYLGRIPERKYNKAITRTYKAIAHLQDRIKYFPACLECDNLQDVYNYYCPNI